eukprot:3588755-Pyramimonas_sp.AAC.1
MSYSVVVARGARYKLTRRSQALHTNISLSFGNIGGVAALTVDCEHRKNVDSISDTLQGSAQLAGIDRD